MAHHAQKNSDITGTAFAGEATPVSIDQFPEIDALLRWPNNGHQPRIDLVPEVGYQEVSIAPFVSLEGRTPTIFPRMTKAVIGRACSALHSRNYGAANGGDDVIIHEHVQLPGLSRVPAWR